MDFGIKKKHIPVFILCLFGALMFFMGIMNHYYFRSFVFDYGNYNFAFWDYSHFRISDIPTYPGNFLQDHYSFLLFYFIPVYWLLNWITGSYTLILIQNTLIVVAAWYSYKLVKVKSNNLFLTTGVIILYFLLLGRYSTFACDTNLAVMSACFIPVFLYYFEIRNYIVSSILLILALLARENIPIWFLFIFTVLIIQNLKDKKAVLFSIGGIILSIGYFILLFKVLIPSVESAEKQFTLFNYAALGATPGEALKFVITHPFETIKLFFVNHLGDPALDRIKTEFYLVYLISGGFILFRRPQYLIWFIPIVAQKVLNDAPARWGILTYYSIEVVTILPLSVFLTLSSIKSNKWINCLSIIVCLMALSMTINKMDRRNRVVPDDFLPEKEKVFYHKFYKSNYNLNATHKLLKSIPTDAKVSASEDFFTHLAQRFHIYFFPEVNDAEYIIFSVFDNNFNYTQYKNESARSYYFDSNEWEIIGTEYPVYLLKKTDKQLTTSRFSFLSEFESETISCDFETLDTTSTFLIFNNKVIADSKKIATTTYCKSDSSSLLLDNNNCYGRAIDFSTQHKLKYIKVNVWVKGDFSKAFIVAKHNTEKFHLHSNKVVEENDSGWKKIELKCWVPKITKESKFFIHLWNAGKENVYFDDLEITTWY